MVDIDIFTLTYMYNVTDMWSVWMGRDGYWCVVTVSLWASQQELRLVLSSLGDIGQLHVHT